MAILTYQLPQNILLFSKSIKLGCFDHSQDEGTPTIFMMG